MRDLVDIGMGRTARQTFELDDINIVPSRRTRSSSEVSTAWQRSAYFDTPILTHPTDALVSPASRSNSVGGGARRPQRWGLWARHRNVQGEDRRVIAIAIEEVDPSAAIRRLQELHAALDTGLLGENVARVREAGVTTAVRVSPQHAREVTPTLVAAGVDLLVIHGTIISAEHVSHDGREPLNLKTFISELDIPVVAGGVHDHRTAAPDADRRGGRDRRIRLGRGVDHHRRGAGDRCRWRRRSPTPRPRARAPRRDRWPLRA